MLDTVTEPEKMIWCLKRMAQNCMSRFRAMPFIDGTEVDYVREGLNQLFKFHNPKAPERMWLRRKL